MRRRVAGADASNLQTRRALGRALEELGQFFLDRRDRERALPLYREGLALTEQLAALAPDQPDLLGDVVIMHFGVVSSTRRQEDAERAIAAATELHRRGAIDAEMLAEITAEVRRVVR
jgi:hypothetical protein